MAKTATVVIPKIPKPPRTPLQKIGIILLWVAPLGLATYLLLPYIKNAVASIRDEFQKVRVEKASVPQTLVGRDALFWQVRTDVRESEANEGHDRPFKARILADDRGLFQFEVYAYNVVGYHQTNLFECRRMHGQEGQIETVSDFDHVGSRSTAIRDDHLTGRWHMDKITPTNYYGWLKTYDVNNRLVGEYSIQLQAKF